MPTPRAAADGQDIVFSMLRDDDAATEVWLGADGGAATTSFFIDPAEELITIFMTQVLPSSAYPLRRELRTMVYAAITESNL